MLLVSVILPAFNASETIECAIRSILDGTFSDLELIVVDDGSTDDTAAVVGAIEDDRLRLFTQNHAGVAAAANRAAQNARGRYIARMDADDFAHPARLEKQVALLECEALDVIGTCVRIVDSAGKAVPSMQRYERWVNRHVDHDAMVAMRFVESPLVNPTLLARREVFSLGQRQGDFPEDYDFILRAFAAGYCFGKVDEVLLDWTDGPSRLTRTDERYSFAAFDRCGREHLRAGPLRSVNKIDLWGIGQTGKPWLLWLQSEGLEVRCAFDIDPRKVSETIHSVKVQHVDNLPNADGTPILIAVGAAGARKLIRPHLKERGYTIGGDAWFVA